VSAVDDSMLSSVMKLLDGMGAVGRILSNVSLHFYTEKSSKNRSLCRLPSNDSTAQCQHNIRGRMVNIVVAWTGEFCT
jgi:hypothetical protein